MKNAYMTISKNYNFNKFSKHMTKINLTHFICFCLDNRIYSKASEKVLEGKNTRTMDHR